MKQVFLNHKTEDKTIILQINEYLNKCFIPTWLDNKDIPAGNNLASCISNGISKSPIFCAFISYKYLRSNWCMHELRRAYDYSINKKVTIIPILLETKDELKINELECDEDKQLIKDILQLKAIKYDRYDLIKSCEEINENLFNHIGLKFQPLTTKKIDGTTLQCIEFESTTLLDNFLSTWDFPPLGKDSPITLDNPVSISGKGPAWIYSHITINFKNLCSVYIYNKPSDAYICVYDHSNNNDQLGKVLKDR